MKTLIIKEDKVGKILSCNCINIRAAKWWGKGRRLQNYAPKGLPPLHNPGWRCVVCTTVKPLEAK